MDREHRWAHHLRAQDRRGPSMSLSLPSLPLPRALAIAIAFAALAALGPRALADVITLKDGSRLEGKIVSEDAKHVVVSIAFGTLTVPKDQVVSIVQAEAPETAFRRKLSDLGPDDVAGRISLARDALNRFYLRDLAGELAVEAWHLSPESASATALLQELDYKREGRSWVPPERWYPDHGYVRRDKRWMWREEAAWRDAVVETAKAKTASDAAQAAAKAAQGDIESAIARQGQAASDAQRCEAEVARIDGQIAEAKATADARQRDLDTAEANLRRAGAEAARERTLAGAISSDSALYLQDAENRVVTARKQRDDALAELSRRTQLRGAAAAASAEARARVEKAVADERLAREQLPRRKAEAEAAVTAHAGAQAVEYAAKVDLDNRKAKEGKG